MIEVAEGSADGVVAVDAYVFDDATDGVAQGRIEDVIESAMAQRSAISLAHVVPSHPSHHSHGRNGTRIERAGH